MVELEEPVYVGALFERHRITPVWFRWRGRRIDLKQVTMSWRSTQGRSRLTHFAVTDGLNLYELTVNHWDLTWHLTCIRDGSP